MRKPLKGKILKLTVIIFTSISLPIHSESPEVLNKRGVQLGKQKSYNRAVKEFNKALKIYNNSSAKSLHNLAWVLELKGNIKDAIKNYEEAIRRSPSQLPSYKRLGYLYYETGEYEKAVNIGEYILKEEPGNSEVLKWLPEAYKLKLKKEQGKLIAKKTEEDKKRREDQRERMLDERSEKRIKKESSKSKPETLTQDLFLKIGYIPAYRTTFDKYQSQAIDDIELYGFSLQAENNIYLNGVWIGIGLEWQRLERKNSNGYYLYNYMMPLLSLKYLTPIGLYFGAGISGKYLISTSNPDADPLKAKKTIDLWANAIIGFFIPIDEKVIFCFENRIGYNTTKRQFTEFDDSSIELDIKSSYDFAFYIGIGLRIKYLEQ